nr:hypothetical protein [Tanacetum cinerariifolium]
MGKSSNLSVSQIDEASKKDLEDLFQDFYDEYFDSLKIMKSSTTNVENSINDEVFHEISESFQGESSSSSLNDDPHEKKWTKDHPLHKIIGDSKLSVRTRGQLANSCLFSCLLSSIELANVAEALRDADWSFKWTLRQHFFKEFLRRKFPTPMVEQAKLKHDLVEKLVDHTDYQSMIGSLMYVTSSRPEIMFATCICARYHANPNEHHVSAIKRIFYYLKGTINLGLWYLKDSGFDLIAYSDAYHAGCHLDRKTESEYVAVSGYCAQVLWMHTQLTDYGFFYDKVPIYCNSKSAIAIDRRLSMRLLNDIYFLIDSNKTAKDLWDALARHMLGSEYGEQDRKAAVLYEYETFKAIEGELLLDTYIRYLQVINDLKKCVYSKDNCELNFMFLNNLQPEWKQHATMMRQNKNLMDINIDALYNILKQNQGDVNDAMGSKRKLLWSLLIH